jgi:hypothetical protein
MGKRDQINNIEPEFAWPHAQFIVGHGDKLKYGGGQKKT